MTLSYQLTYDDFREAHLGVKPAKSGRSLGPIIGWVVFVGLAVMLFLLLNSGGRRTSVEPPRVAPSHATRLGAAVLPSIVLCAVMAIFVLRSAKPSATKPWDPPPHAASAKKRSFGQGIFGWLLFIALAVMLFTLLQNRPRRVPVPVGPLNPPAPLRVETEASIEMFDFLLGLAPMVLTLFAFLALSKLVGDRNIRRAWGEQPSVQRPQTVDATESGITFVDDLHRQECQWSYFAGFKETPNLFLLYPSPLTLHIIPKRGFADVSDMVAFRGLLLSGVKHGHFLEQPSAFPVVPLAAKAPGSA